MKFNEPGVFARLRAGILAGLLLAVCAQVAHADVIQFDPDGAGPNPTASVEQFDYQPGNGVFVNLGAANAPKLNQPFTYLFQTRLGNLLDTNSNVIPVPGLNQPGGFEITAIMTFEGMANGTSSPTVYSQAPGFSEFRLFYDDNPLTQANDLAGTGFDDGVSILSGTLSQADGSFSIIPAAPLPMFDSFGPDNYGGKTSLLSAGGADYTIMNLSTLPSFFITAAPVLQLHLLNSSNTTPFDQVNPSHLFQPNFANYTPVLGPTNGLGQDFQVQTDANGSFLVPEPNTLVLFSLAGIGWGAFALRRRAQPLA